MELGIQSSSTRDPTLTGRIAWITALRLAFLVLLLGATAILYLRGELARYPFSLRIVFVTIAGGFALAALYAVTLRSGKHLQELAWTQIVLDQVTWTAIVYVSGGATSGATSFYALTCLIGAVLVGVRGALGRRRWVSASTGSSARASTSAGCTRRRIRPPRGTRSTRPG